MRLRLNKLFDLIILKNLRTISQFYQKRYSYCYCTKKRHLRLQYTFKGVSCSAAGFNSRYLHPYIKLKLMGLAIRLCQKF